MAAPLQPGDEQDICDAVAEAAASHARLEIVGGGSKRTIGHPHRETLTLSTARLAGITDYDPAELILTVQPGARLVEVEALLARNSQMLAFEPYDFARVVGAAPGQSTIGGMVGAGIAGSRRVSAGGVRDHMLGFSAVNGLGQRFKAGGKVVKNVTGYDLPKMMAGSWGQLAALTELTLKVLPKPQMVRTLVLHGLSNETALAAMTRAIGSRADVAAASHVPAPAGEEATTAIRIEGFGPSVEARERLLRSLLSDIAAVDVMAGEDAEAHWSKVRTASCLAAEDRPVLWRISIPPARGAELLRTVTELDGLALLDWAGGLSWARTPLSTSADAIRKLAERAGGHAMLVDAPTEIRVAAPALHPEPPAVAALSQRVREAFDPAGVFDPQRFAAP
jgi:glycolate oxidase FAD binding subunit